MLGDIILIAIIGAIIALMWFGRRSRKRGVSTTTDTTHNLFWLSNRGGSDTHSSDAGGGGE